MTFAPLDLCSKLVNMGCKSVSDFGWHVDFREPLCLADGSHSLTVYMRSCMIAAFTLEDFVGTTPEARENARIVFGPRHRRSYEDQGRPFNPSCTCRDCSRHRMIDSTSWIKYIEETMK